MNLNIKIYEEFTPGLKEYWSKLYSERKGAYNSSYEWCYTWFKYFGNDKKLFIIAIWQEQDIKLIAPFYKKGNRIYAIGSCPDFYDMFDVLYKDEEYLLALINFMVEHQFEMDFRFISSDSDFFRYLMRRTEQENIYNIKIYNHTVNPLIYKDNSLINNIKKLYNKNIKRREKLIIKDYQDEFKYDFNAEKSERYFNEFVSFHIRKWNTFKSAQTKQFIKELYFNCDFTFLSRLSFKNTDETIAYDLNYIGSNNVLYYNLRTYNEKYSMLGPGIFMLYNDLATPDIVESVNYFDFGRGSQDYKYLFSNKEKVVICIKANLSWKRHKWLFLHLKMLKNKLLGGV